MFDVVMTVSLCQPSVQRPHYTVHYCYCLEQRSAPKRHLYSSNCSEILDISLYWGGRKNESIWRKNGAFFEISLIRGHYSLCSVVHLHSYNISNMTSIRPNLQIEHQPASHQPDLIVIVLLVIVFLAQVKS